MNRQELVQLAQDPAIRSTMETADAAFVDVVLTVVNRALAHKNQIWPRELKDELQSLRDRNADLLRQLYAERSEIASSRQLANDTRAAYNRLEKDFQKYLDKYSTCVVELEDQTKNLEGRLKTAIAANSAHYAKNKALAAVVSGLEDKVAALQLDLSLANDR